MMEILKAARESGCDLERDIFEFNGNIYIVHIASGYVELCKDDVI